MQLVYSSAPADDIFRAQLSKHLQPLVQQKRITEWHARLILPGVDTALERRRAWNSADILLLLLSADYFLSEDFRSDELQSALDRQRRGQLLIVPILLHPCEWRATNLAYLQCLPRNGQAVALWEHQEEALYAVAQEIGGLVAARQFPAAALSPLQRKNRLRLLKKVRAYWIEGLLEKSLRQTVWVDLHLQKQPGIVENPWRLMVQELDLEPRSLPPGTSIIQVFDQADEELLILGEPGSGKTTLLLYLARTLLDRAENDESRRIPVVFNLASWGQQRLPLDRWLLEELKIRYEVPAQVGRVWIEADQLFLLLDGLDEVAESARAACVQAIAAFARRSPEQIPLVICCRNEEYQELSVQLPLQFAVMLLPFTDDQIETYLSSISGEHDVLREMLHEDRDLFELARRPLMLSTFARAYQGATALDFPSPAARDEYPRALFGYYIRHMLGRRAQLQQGTEEQTYRWLSYLARQLRLQQQTIFTVEHLQPAWLPEHFRGWYRWSMPLVYGLAFGLLFGPIFGLAFSFVYGLIYRTIARAVFGLFLGLILGLVGGLSGGLVFGITFKQHMLIRPTEVAAWSWMAAGKGLLFGLLGGMIVGLAGGLLGGILAGPGGGFAVGLAVTLVIGFAGGLVGGSSPEQLPERSSLAPNAGIWRSGRRGLLLVLCVMLVFGVGAGLIFGLFGKSLLNPLYGLIFGLVLGAGGGLIFGLAFGSVGGRTGIAAFLQHFVLRVFLWRLKLLPWKLVPFLDDASRRLLLYKIGGSYIFVHRLLRDVLAAQDN